MSERRIVVDPVTRIEGHLRVQATFQSIPWLQVRWAYAAIPVSAFFMTIYGVRDLILAVRAFLPAKSA